MRLIDKVNEPECINTTTETEESDLNVSNTREAERRQGQKEQYAGQTVGDEVGDEGISTLGWLQRESSTKGHCC